MNKRLITWFLISLLIMTLIIALILITPTNMQDDLPTWLQQQHQQVKLKPSATPPLLAMAEAYQRTAPSPESPQNNIAQQPQSDPFNFQRLGLRSFDDVPALIAKTTSTPPKRPTSAANSALNALSQSTPPETKLTRARQITTAQDALLSREARRSKEPLEYYPLNAMALVGVVNLQGERVAMVKADETIYPVRMGQYLGQQYGRVTAVGENMLQLRELVINPQGEWSERLSSLQLQNQETPFR